MKKRLTVGVIVTAMAATMSFVVAGPYGHEHQAAGPLPPDQIVASVQYLGLVPTTRAFRRGPYYVLHALDRRGNQFRVVADAALGDIVDITPIYEPRFDAGPRIIHVPQPGERDEAALPDEKAVKRAPAPRHSARPAHRRTVKHAPAPAPQPRRSVRSVPPPPAQGLSPIYPTPRFKAKQAAPRASARDGKSAGQEQAGDTGAQEQTDKAAEKFRAPDAQADRTRLAPPRYSPPPPAQD